MNTTTGQYKQCLPLKTCILNLLMAFLFKKVYFDNNLTVIKIISWIYIEQQHPMVEIRIM